MTQCFYIQEYSTDKIRCQNLFSYLFLLQITLSWKFSCSKNFFLCLSHQFQCFLILVFFSTTRCCWIFYCTFCLLLLSFILCFVWLTFILQITSQKIQLTFRFNVQILKEILRLCLMLVIIELIVSRKIENILKVLDFGVVHIWCQRGMEDGDQFSIL